MLRLALRSMRPAVASLPVAQRSTAPLQHSIRCMSSYSETVMDRWHGYHCHWKSKKFIHLFNEDSVIREYLRNFDPTCRCYITRSFGTVSVKVYTTYREPALYKYLSLVLPVLVRKKVKVSFVYEPQPFLAHRSKAPLLGLRVQFKGLPSSGVRQKTKVWMSEGMHSGKHSESNQYNFEDHYMTTAGSIGVKMRYTFGKPASLTGLLHRRPELVKNPDARSKGKKKRRAPALASEETLERVYVTG
eukprot:Rmarinus@m.13972